MEGVNTSSKVLLKCIISRYGLRVKRESGLLFIYYCLKNARQDKLYYSASIIYSHFVAKQMQQSKLITKSYKKLTRFSINKRRENKKVVIANE